MGKRTISLVVAVSLAGHAHAFPVEAIASFFSKLIRGGAKEASVVEKASDGAIVAKGIEHSPMDNAVRTAPVSQIVEPKPNMASEPTAKTRKEVDTYKSLRASADKGDVTAMLRMSEMTSSGKVSDPGEPWHGYWMFQAARLGSQAASKKTHDECSANNVSREADRWFDSACAASDGRHFYLGDKQPNTNSPSRADLLSTPSPQSGVKK